MIQANRNSTFNILSNILLYAIMGFYLFILFALLFGKREVGSFQSVNLIPFREIGAYLFGSEVSRRAFGFSNILGNIALFIPLGVYISLLNRKGKILFNTLFVMLISTGVEILQYLLQNGAADIDDVILNTLGGFIGAVFFYALILLFKQNARTAVTLLSLTCGITVVLYLYVINQPRY